MRRGLQLCDERSLNARLYPSPVSFHVTSGIALIAADKLLVSWGNRASHTFDLTAGEATQLIDVCEAALAAFDAMGVGSQFTSWMMARASCSVVFVSPEDFTQFETCLKWPSVRERR
jgi:hypothetical protein